MTTQAAVRDALVKRTGHRGRVGHLRDDVQLMGAMPAWGAGEPRRDLPMRGSEFRPQVTMLCDSYTVEWRIQGSDELDA